MKEYWRLSAPMSFGHLLWAVDDGIGPYRILRDDGTHIRSEPRDSDLLRASSVIGLGDSVHAEKSQLGLGEHHPRIWRSHAGPNPAVFARREWSSSLQSAQNLFAGMRDVFRYVEPSKKNGHTYGHQIRAILHLACTEVESAWTAILVANKYRGSKRLDTRDYVKLAGPMRLREWELKLTMFPDFETIRPFADWESREPSKSIPWFEAYNLVKHNREAKHDIATMDHMVCAMAALYVIIVAQFGFAHDLRHPHIETESLGHNGAPSIDFTVLKRPSWLLCEQYVPPTLEHASEWIPIGCSF